MDSLPHIVVGTYEEFVLGYKPTTVENEDKELKLSQVFASHSHQASIRCIATYGRWLVSSGADEYINIYDMTTMMLSFVINYHNSTVTCLEFVPDGSYLVTATQDGTIAIFRSCDWILVKVWKDAHKTANGVTSISVHPSGGLMMSTGADNVIKFWNLIKGRVAYVKNFSSKCSPGNTLNMAKWSKDGAHYAVCIGKKVEVYCTETANVTYEIEAPVKVSCIDFEEGGLLSLGTDEGLVELHKFEEKKLVYKESCHTTRIKAIQMFKMSDLTEEPEKLSEWCATADSKGLIKLWNVKKKKSEYSFDFKAEVDVDCRITCLSVVSPLETKQEKTEADSSIESKLNQSTKHKKKNRKKKKNLDNKINLEGNSNNEISNNSSNEKKLKKKKLKPADNSQNFQPIKNLLGKKRKRSVNEVQDHGPTIKKQLSPAGAKKKKNFNKKKKAKKSFTK